MKKILWSIKMLFLIISFYVSFTAMAMELDDQYSVQPLYPKNLLKGDNIWRRGAQDEIFDPLREGKNRNPGDRCRSSSKGRNFLLNQGRKKRRQNYAGFLKRELRNTCLQNDPLWLGIFGNNCFLRAGFEEWCLKGRLLHCLRENKNQKVFYKNNYNKLLEIYSLYIESANFYAHSRHKYIEKLKFGHPLENLNIEYSILLLDRNMQLTVFKMHEIKSFLRTDPQGQGGAASPETFYR